MTAPHCLTAYLLKPGLLLPLVAARMSCRWECSSTASCLILYWQRASVTLDAGVKIYSYRVDSVHTETFKILGGLGRASGPADEPEGAASGGCDCAGRVPQWRKTKIAGLRSWI